MMLTVKTLLEKEDSYGHGLLQHIAPRVGQLNSQLYSNEYVQTAATDYTSATCSGT